MNILIIKLGAIGDVLRTTALLPGLKEKYHECRIYWVTKENALDILKHNSLVDKLFVFDSASIKKLKQEEFDLIICLEDEKEACELASALSSKRIFGAYSKDGAIIYSDDSSPWFDMSLISGKGLEGANKLKKSNKRTYQEILYTALGLDSKFNKLELDIGEKGKGFSEEFMRNNKLRKDDKIVGVNTGSSPRWNLKKLSVERTVALIDVLLERSYKVVLLGGPAEKERNNSIVEHFGDSIVDAGTSNSLLEFAAIINACSAIITSDSMAMHMAIALNKKVAAFFGPTSAAEIDMYGRGAKVVPDMPCVCCYKGSCELKPNCMSQVDIGEIMEAIVKWLG